MACLEYQIQQKIGIFVNDQNNKNNVETLLDFQIELAKINLEIEQAKKLNK